MTALGGRRSDGPDGHRGTAARSRPRSDNPRATQRTTHQTDTEKQRPTAGRGTTGRMDRGAAGRSAEGRGGSHADAPGGLSSDGPQHRRHRRATHHTPGPNPATTPRSADGRSWPHSRHPGRAEKRRPTAPTAQARHTPHARTEPGNNTSERRREKLAAWPTPRTGREATAHSTDDTGAPHTTRPDRTRQQHLGAPTGEVGRMADTPDGPRSDGPQHRRTGRPQNTRPERTGVPTSDSGHVAGAAPWRRHQRPPRSR
ncbi:hypothetical protein QFZ32_008659 [Streptomyces canus]|nr:hypothetical protein [Streptomyces canus]